MKKGKPEFTNVKLPSGSTLLRFPTLEDLFWFDNPINNPTGLGLKGYLHQGEDEIDPATGHPSQITRYLKERTILTPAKQKLIAKARKNLQADKEFLELIYKAKSEKRKVILNKFGGNFSPVQFSRQEEKMFKKGVNGAKKATLDMAFQVGTFTDGDYGNSFQKIIKTILMCQAMNINLNIDVFDSEEDGVDMHDAYVICNVARSDKKINFNRLLAFSHQEFFRYTLFNGYAASGKPGRIRSFLGTKTIKEDLSRMYDVIGGNLLPETGEDAEENGMINKIIKIAWH